MPHGGLAALKKRRPPPPAQEPRAAGGHPAAGGPPEGLPLRWPAAWAAAAAAVWTAVVAWRLCATYARLETQPWADFVLACAFLPRIALGYAPRLFYLAGLWLVWFSLGRLLLRFLKAGRPEAQDDTLAWKLEHAMLCAGAGMAAASLGLLLLGLAGFLHPAALRWLFWAALAASCASTLPAACRSGWAPVFRRPSRLPGPWDGAALLLLFCAAVLNLLSVYPPVIFYDALVYHLALPKLYLLRHGIVPTPHNVFTGVPFGVEMLYGWCLALTKDNLPSVLHASLGLAAAAALWAAARRLGGPSTGLLACLLFSLCPAVLVSGAVPGVELGGSFYCVLAFLALLRSAEAPEGRALPWSVLAGWLVGAAMGTKYSLMPVGVVLVATHLWMVRGRPSAWRCTAAMAAAASLAVLPWLVKNAWFYGNPLHPFLNGRLGLAGPADWSGFLASSGSRDLTEVLTTAAGLKRLLLQGWESTMGRPPMNNWPGPAFLLLLPWALLTRWGARPMAAAPSGERRGTLPCEDGGPMAAALAAAGCLAVWTASTSHMRFLIPGLGFVALAVAVAVDAGAFPAWLRRLGWAVAIVAGAFNFQVVFHQRMERGLTAFLSGEQDTARYLMRVRPTYSQPYYSAMAFIDEKLPPDARVLFLGEARAYYCERDFIASTVFDLNPFWTELRGSADAAELSRRLKAMGVTHLFLNASELMHRRDSAVVMPREDMRRQVFDDFWTLYLRKLFEDRQTNVPDDPHWVIVYELLGEPERDPSARPANPARELLNALETARPKEAGSSQARAALLSPETARP
ncbi:MAG: glycosyltransferase family 39 protein [Elusimicrobia bacterium]|nr:glycosyltransferase family 39 protein [Elusimicrobiota bacterium]